MENVQRRAESNAGAVRAITANGVSIAHKFRHAFLVKHRRVGAGIIDDSNMKRVLRSPCFDRDVASASTVRDGIGESVGKNGAEECRLEACAINRQRTWLLAMLKRVGLSDGAQ